MNFDFSEEQQHLKWQARRFLESRCPTSTVRALLDDPQNSFDRGLWAEVAELGWLGAVIPETYGGLGLGYVELCAIAEELGRVIAPIPFASTLYFFAEALLLAGNAEQRRRWLPPIVSSGLIGCMATSEGTGPFDVRRVSACVSRLQLTGAKVPVTDGDIAGVAIVLAAEDGRPCLFIVDLEGSGVRRERLESIDGSRGLCRLVFDGARAERLGEPGAGLELTAHILERAAVMLSFEQLGGADRCLEMACEHALHRYAFGRPIGGNQAIKHRLAETYVKNELARSNAYYAAWALESGAGELPVAAAAARLAANDAFGFSAAENIHVHGGMGVTWEGDSHLYFRRARHLSLVAGSTFWWSERLVSALVRNASAESAAETRVA